MKKELNKELNTAINLAVENKAKEKDAQQYIEDLKAEVQSGDERAVSSLQDLVNLIVITYNEATLLSSTMTSFVSQFIDEPRDDNGNGRRYIKHFIQRPTDYNPNSFIPTAKSNIYQKVQFIKFKNDNGSLAPGSVQKLFEFTYIESDLITYFINGQLREFIEEQIIAQIDDSLRVYIYDYVMKQIVNTAGMGREVNGTAGNLFDAFTQEIFPVCKDMTLNSNRYNVDRTLTEAIDASRKEDLVMIMSIKTKTMLESNIKSQLFNSAKIDLNNYVGQVHIPNNTFTFNNEIVGVNDVQYIPENKIIVFDKRNYLKVLTMLKTAGSQSYPRNLAVLKVLHCWLASGKLGWGKVFTYTNNNLNTSPSA